MAGGERGGRHCEPWRGDAVAPCGCGRDVMGSKEPERYLLPVVERSCALA